MFAAARVEARDWMIASLLVLVALSLQSMQVGTVLAQLFAAVVAAVLVDEAWGVAVSREGLFSPKSAVITGILVAILFPPGTALPVVSVAAVAAILAKRVVRWGASHVFNPANIGFLAVAAVLNVPAGWWVIPAPVNAFDAMRFAAVILFGSLLAFKVKRLPAAFSFLASQAVLLSGVALVLGQSPLSWPSLIPWFFALFMLIEPVTSSTPSLRDQVAFGIVASAATVLFIFALPAWPSNAALVVANVFAAWRRASNQGWKFSALKATAR